MKKLILILFLIHNITSAQVIANLDTNNILIGDHITFTLEGEIDKDSEWPIFTDSIGNLELLSVSEIDSTPTEKGWKLKQHFILTQWDSGFYHIPSISVGEEKTEAFVVIINTITLKEDAEAKDIKGPIDAPVTFSEALPYLLVLIIVLLLIFLLIHYLKREKPIEIIATEPEVILPPFEIALTQLEKLKIKMKSQRIEIKAYYSDLSEIIRTYIEDGLHTPAMEMLTDDIIKSLKARRINTKQLSILLSTADMAKFAKAKPTNAENELTIKFAFDFIHQTKPQDNDE